MWAREASRCAGPSWWAEGHLTETYLRASELLCSSPEEQRALAAYGSCAPALPVPLFYLLAVSFWSKC